MTDEDVLVPVTALHSFASDVLSVVGMSPADTSFTVDAMLWGELRGLAAHGVSGKLPQCVDRIRAGGTDPTAELETMVSTGPIRVVDAHDAWGQVAAARAMGMAIELARSNGIGLVSVRECSSAAAMGHYTNLATNEGLAAFAFTNGSAIIAPWGGSRRLLGNQAHSIGCPAGRHAPIIYDSAVTKMSTGEIDALQEQGRALPDDVLLDAAGKPTRDPAAWLTGMLLPSGGHRGYGLAVMLELLTGVLSGGKVFAPDVGQPGDVAVRQGISLFLLAIDPASMMPLPDFLARVDTLLDRIHGTPRTEGVERLYYPGERSAEVAAFRSENGIPLPRPRLDRLRALGRDVGVSFDA